MRSWLRGKSGGFVAFLAITALVAGGLGWVTAAAVRLEQEQLAARAEAEHYNNLRLALWRLDSLIAPALAKEDSRPYNHYSAIYAPPLVLQPNGRAWEPGTVLEPSPLIGTELPAWMALHFQTDRGLGWRSPQVHSPALEELLRTAHLQMPLTNVTGERARLLAELARQIRAQDLVAQVEQQSNRPPLQDTTLVPGGNSAFLSNRGPPNYSNSPIPLQSVLQGQMAQSGVDKEYQTRLKQGDQQLRSQSKSLNDQSGVVFDNLARNGEDWLLRKDAKHRASEQVAVSLGPMTPFWLSTAGQPERLIVARHVKIGKKEICQGIILDWPALQSLLTEQVKGDLFPLAQVRPVREEVPLHSERAMTVLPVELDPGPLAADVAALGWTPLRVGLVLAWAAALVGLMAVGLGGWSLLDLSERRIRFVSAVTHELRTPLTTLRLYLDMLAGGMIKDPRQKEEYLQTLNAEADRLNRLVGNVLDFSRLENQRPRLARSQVVLGDILEQTRASWQTRCASAGKELVLENDLGADVVFLTDVQMVQQILGNLIDNACKYSCGAADRRIWLRAGGKPGLQFWFEVEDQGPGVPARERRSIFRPFRRGQGVDATAGGVGLGLALAQRWAHLLGGKLSLHPGQAGQGACFRLHLSLA
jgi:signal transduction histidine kinase